MHSLTYHGYPSVYATTAAARQRGVAYDDALAGQFIVYSLQDNGDRYDMSHHATLAEAERVLADADFVSSAYYDGAHFVGIRF